MYAGLCYLYGVFAIDPYACINPFIPLYSGYLQYFLYTYNITCDMALYLVLLRKSQQGDDEVTKPVIL